MRTGLVRVAFVLLAGNALWMTGCATAAKQALHEVLGARGEVLLVTEVSETALAEVQSLRFAPVATTLGHKLCPSAVIHAYDKYATRLGEELKDEYPGGSPALMIDGEILYFREKGILGSAQCLTRVKMHTDDRLVVDALVNAQSKSFREGGAKDLAKASVEALGKFLKEQEESQEN